MGIKFRCPNGHKLHVKTFLSGKRAICPKCGTSVLVPVPDEMQVGAAPRFVPVSVVPDAPAKGTPPAVPATVPDPIDAEPEALWYVRPASGGQFGPAAADVMREWIASGRVGAGSLVWHDGWPEWRTAAAIFPQLAGLLAAPPVAAQGIAPRAAVVSTGSQDVSAVDAVGPVESSVPRSSAVPPEEEMALFRPPRRRPRKTDASVIASSILVVVSIILVIVLVVVFNYRSAADQTNDPEGRASVE